MNTYTFNFSGDITVKAETEEEARELAEDLVSPTAYASVHCEDGSRYEVQLR